MTEPTSAGNGADIHVDLPPSNLVRDKADVTNKRSTVHCNSNNDNNHTGNADSSSIEITGDAAGSEPANQKKKIACVRFHIAIVLAIVMRY